MARSLLVAALAATAALNAAAGGQDDPPLSDEERMQIMAEAGRVTDAQIAVMVRVDYPMPGDPPPTDEDRSAANAVRLQLGGSYFVPGPQHPPVASELIEPLLRPSADQRIAIESRLDDALLAASRRYVTRLREAATIAHATFRDEMRELGAARSEDEVRSQRRLVEAQEIVRRSAITFSEAGADAATLAAPMVDPVQAEGLAVLVEAVRQHVLLGAIGLSPAGAAASPIRRVIAFLEQEHDAGRDVDRKAVVAALLETLPARRSALLALLRSESTFWAAILADTEAAGERLGIGDGSPKFDRAQRRLTDAHDRLVAANEAIVERVAATFPPEAARRLRREGWRQEVYRFARVTRPDEWEEAIRLVREAEPPARVSRVVDARVALVDAAQDAVFRRVLEEERRFFGAGDRTDEEETRRADRELAERHLAAEREVLAAMDAVHAELVAAADERPGLAALAERVLALRATSVAAAAEASRLEREGAAPWASGLSTLGWRSWSRPTPASGASPESSGGS